ncbi:MAG TPA: hypothetical protein VFE71_03105, partial [Bacteroidales bacterium]|nr:hypothetical protein [Bacteroidales bacterium]
RIADDYTNLIRLLNEECSTSLSTLPIRFQIPEKNMLMKSMYSNNSIITIIINKRKSNAQISLDFGGKNPSGKTLFATALGKVIGTKVQIGPEETIVIKWN